jgi:hypothetical protein
LRLQPKVAYDDYGKSGAESPLWKSLPVTAPQLAAKARGSLSAKIPSEDHAILAMVRRPTEKYDVCSSSSFKHQVGRTVEFRFPLS